MSKWEKMDRICWENSEVMKRFEKLISEANAKMQEKVVEAQSQQISQKLQDINKNIETTSQGMNKFIDMSKNLAKDEKENQENEEEGISPEDHQAAKAQLIMELEGLAAKAALEGDHPLAYKIERSIDSLLFEE